MIPLAKSGKFWVNLNPLVILKSLHINRGLMSKFVVRFFHERHKGSFLGVFWSILLPIMMMALYTLVFGFIFGSSYNVIPNEQKVDFGLGIFLSLTLFGMVSDALALSPTTILDNPNFVQKVVFPLEILPVANFGALFLNVLISFTLFLFGQTFIGTGLSIHALWFPVLVIPLILLSMGLFWFFSALGVFLRDLSQFMVFATQALLYSSAIFYSTSKVLGTNLEFLLPFLQTNPIVRAVETGRNIMLWHLPVQMEDLLYLYLFGGITFCVGFAFFQLLKPAFSDVI